MRSYEGIIKISIACFCLGSNAAQQAIEAGFVFCSKSLSVNDDERLSAFEKGIRVLLVEAAGVEPASGNTPLKVLHA